MTQEQETALLDMLAKATAPAPTPAPTPAPAPAPAPAPEGLLSEAKKAIVADSKQSEQLSELSTAIKFCLSVSDFIKANSGFLPPEAAKVFELSNARVYDSDVSKANVIRKTLLCSYIETQANIDGLPLGMQERAKAFLALNEQEKERQSAAYWDIIDVGVELKKQISKANALRRGQEPVSSEFHRRFMDLGNKYLGEK